jgi:hypothetical protein
VEASKQASKQALMLLSIHSHGRGRALARGLGSNLQRQACKLPPTVKIPGREERAKIHHVLYMSQISQQCLCLRHDVYLVNEADVVVSRANNHRMKIQTK